MKKQVRSSVVKHEIRKEKLKSVWKEITEEDLRESVSSIASRFCVDVKIDFVDKAIILDGRKDSVKYAELEIGEWALRHEALKNSYPNEWEAFPSGAKWHLPTVKANSPEWNRIIGRIQATMSDVKVEKIERVQNRLLYNTFVCSRARIADKNVR